MKYIRNFRDNLCKFCGDVVRWRSIFTIPYVMIINFAFCTVAFYADAEKQIQCLYGIIGFVILTDLLFSSTRDHSIMYEIVSWPIRDLFRTFGVLLCALAVYELKNEEKEEAFISSAAAVLSVAIDPVYKHNKISDKICTLFCRIGRALKYFLTNFVVLPLMVAFGWIKYIVLFKWIPALKWLRGRWGHVCEWLDHFALRHVRAMFRRLGEIARYWAYFYWWTDLRHWTARVIFRPLLEKLTNVLNAFVYVVGCYWLIPLLKQVGRQFVEMRKYCLNLMKEASILFGIYVIQPILVALYAQFRVAFGFFYAVAIQPIVNLCYEKYKFVEDQIFIYILGPFFQKLVDIVPEKNPFAETSDAELTEFLPKSPPTDDRESGCESDSSTRSPTSHISSVNLDEHEFMPKGLKRVDISCSDSSDAEFSLIPSRSRRSKRQKNRMSVLSALSFGTD